MAGGINISIGSDEKDFLRGVKNSETSLDGLGDALKDVDKQGSKAGDALEGDFKNAQVATKRFNDTVADGADELQKTARSSKQTAMALSDDFETSTRKGKESFKELGNEARQNASETFSSFDGSAQSFVDGIQGTLGGIVSSLGPLGAAAGAAGALGIGLVSAALGDAATRADELKQRTEDAFKDMIQSGKDYVSADFVNQSIATQLSPDKANEYKQSLADAKNLHLDIGVVLRANAGDSAAIYEIQNQINVKSSEINSAKNKGSDIDGSTTEKLSNQLTTLDNIKNRYGDVAASNDTAASKMKVYLDATNQTAEGVNRINANLGKIPQSQAVKFTADVDFSGALSAITAFGKKSIAIPVNFSSNGKKIPY